MTARQCPTCGGTIATGTLCAACLDNLHDDLAAIGDAITELHTQLARQARTGNDGGQARSAIRPLPYDQAASDALDLLRSVLVGWTRDVWETQAHDAPSGGRGGPVQPRNGRRQAIPRPTDSEGLERPLP
jgi:hypothetical protein